MRVRHVVQDLLQLPQDAKLEFTRLLAVNDANELFEVRLDFPIVGTAFHEDRQEVLLVIEHDIRLGRFAVVKRLVDPPEA